MSDWRTEHKQKIQDIESRMDKIMTQIIDQYNKGHPIKYELIMEHQQLHDRWMLNVEPNDPSVYCFEKQFKKGLKSV